MIVCCRLAIRPAGRLWDQNADAKRPALIANLGAAVTLRDAYLDVFRCRDPATCSCCNLIFIAFGSMPSITLHCFQRLVGSRSMSSQSLLLF